MKSILLLFALYLFAFANEKVVLQLNWKNQFQFAGYYMAKELGYYRDAGLDVTIKEFDNTTDMSNVIEKGEADFAIGRSSLLIDKINGKDRVALGAIYQETPLILLVRADTGINTLKDLKGKKIMLTNDAKDTASIMAMLFSSGLRLKDIDIVPHSFNINDLIDKKVDAMASYISNEPILLDEQGIPYKIFSPQDYGFHFYGDILFTSSAYIKKHPKLTKKFYEASIKGWEYAFDNIAQTAEVIHAKYNSQHKTVIELIKEGEVLTHLAHKGETPLGYIDKDQLNDIVKVYKVLGIVNKDADLKNFVYEYNHPKELAFKLSYKDIWFVAIIALLFFLSLDLLLLFISFRNRWLHSKKNMSKVIELQKEEIDNQHKIILVQSKIAAVGEMLSNIAHQWRQPLNIISLNTVKLQTSVMLGGKIDSDEIVAMTDEINKQTQYLSQTIDDFRNYFSHEENMQEFDVKETIGKINELVKDGFKNSQIEIALSLDSCTVKSNENLLIQALLNIFNNAKDAIVEHGDKNRYFFVDVKCLKKDVVISIKDSGRGIAPEAVEKIFEPYFTTKHKSKGTGLGLYITYSIIKQQLRGSISVHNREYNYEDMRLKGAEFMITLPKVP